MNRKRLHMSTSLKALYREYKSVLMGVSFVLCVTILSTIGQSEWFKSSLLEVTHPFNGTVTPIEFSPDYTKWTGDIRAVKYSAINKSDLVELPEYTDSLKVLSDSELASNNTVKNAMITFPVVYLGTYQYDHTENKGSHLAVDIRVPEDTPVRAIANGTVNKVDLREYGFGHHMCVQHIDVPDYSNPSDKTTLVSCYSHMNDIYVEEGQFVFKGDVVGGTGSTGTATTPHLHFQIDSGDAPWHPYWPFSSAEASNAGYSFFDAVNAGLNQDNAIDKTVNPMKWISDNYSEDGMNGSLVATTDDDIDDSDDEDEDPELSKFVISGDKSTFPVGEDVTITITAKDQYNNTYKAYKSST